MTDVWSLWLVPTVTGIVASVFAPVIIEKIKINHARITIFHSAYGANENDNGKIIANSHILVIENGKLFQKNVEIIILIDIESGEYCRVIRSDTSTPATDVLVSQSKPHSVVVVIENLVSGGQVYIHLKWDIPIEIKIEPMFDAESRRIFSRPVYDIRLNTAAKIIDQLLFANAKQRLIVILLVFLSTFVVISVRLGLLSL